MSKDLQLSGRRKMKNKFELSLIVIVGLLVALILYFVFSDEEQISVFKYDSIEYNDLVSRNAKFGFYAIPENIQKQSCFSIPKNDPENIFSEHLADMSDIIEDIGLERTAPKFYTMFDSAIKTSLALDMIERYDFTATAIKTHNNIKKIPDTAYHFDCPVDYENEQLMLRIMFESYFWENIPVYVNMTRNDLRVPVLTNNNIIVFAGGVNSTVLFQNDLDKEITIRSIDPINYQRSQNDRFYNLEHPEIISENKFAKITNEDKITIPPGKAFSYHFSSWSNPNSIPLNYTISPSNLKGTIIVMPYPDCASLEDILFVYSRAHKVPELPTYLPDGYEYECGSYHYPEPVTLSYANHTLAEKFKGKIGHGKNPDFLSAGGLEIMYHNMKSYGMYDFWPRSDKFTELTERFSKEQMVTYLKGHPTVLEKVRYDELVNRITVYLDENTRYVVEGGISFSELYKIAESIPFEKGDKSIPETFDNPFKDKSLIIEPIEMKEIYQPGQPISFEIFTQGHIPVASHLAVTIHDSDGSVVWQNTPSADIGDPEIGYVDYTWSTEYDLGVPQIHDTGDYAMTISWNDVTMQHKFQIREEIQFSLLQDMIPEYAHQEDFLSVFDNDCSRKEMNQTSVTNNTLQDIQKIRDKLKENDQLLNFIFEKQEVVTNDVTKTFSYDVPGEVIHCIENIKKDRMNIVENLEQHGEKPEFDIQLLLRESEILYHGHEYKQVIKTADFIIENLDNDNADALIVKGNSLARLGQYEEAIETYGITIEDNPDFAEGWFRMGRALSSNDQHEVAIQHFDQAIKIDPRYADAYIGKAFTLLILERYEDALKSAEKAVQINPDMPVYRDIYQTILDVSKSQ